MRHLLFIAVLSVVITPIVAIQEQLSGHNGSQTTMQSQILHSLDRMSRETTNFVDRAESRISSVVNELMD